MSSLPPQDPYGQQGGRGESPPPYGAPPPPPHGAPPPNYGAPPPDYSATAPYQSQSSGGQAWAGPPLADWGTRVVAYLIDLAIGVVAAIVLVIVAAVLAKIAGALAALVLVLGYAAIIGFTYWNLGWQVGVTGQSIGKKQMHIRVLKEVDGQPLGGGLGIVRQLAHFVDGIICSIGYLFPLWDPKKQTLADKIMSTVVIKEAA